MYEYVCVFVVAVSFLPYNPAHAVAAAAAPHHDSQHVSHLLPYLCPRMSQLPAAPNFFSRTVIIKNIYMHDLGRSY